MVSEGEKQRFRSFAERYVINRCAQYRTGQEGLEDAWGDVEEAKRIYTMIANKAELVEDPPSVGRASNTQQSPGAAVWPPVQQQQRVAQGAAQYPSPIGPGPISPVKTPVTAAVTPVRSPMFPSKFTQFLNRMKP